MPTPTTNDPVAEAVALLLEPTGKTRPILPELQKRFGRSVREACAAIGQANVARRQS